MKIKNTLLAVLLAFSMVGTAACSVFSSDGGGNGSGLETVTYKLTLNVNGGELPDDAAQFFTAGKRFVLPEPTRENFTFGGWFDNEALEGSPYAAISPSDANSDKEFWAKWTPVSTEQQTPQNPSTPKAEYKITLYLNGGTLEGASGTTKTYTRKEDEDFTLPMPTKSGYEFDGWFESSTFDGGAVKKVDKSDKNDKTFYAKWVDEGTTTQKVTVTFNYNYSGSPAPATREFDKNSHAQAITKPTRDGYDFSGWFTESSGGTQFNFNSTLISENITLYAHWQAKTYTVTLNKNGGDLKSGSVDVTEYTYGTAKTLPELVKSGSTFDGWFDNSGFTGNKYTEIAAGSMGNKEFWAKFTTSTVTPTESITVTACAGYEEGAYIEFTPVSGATYTVQYKKHSSGSWTNLDEKLVRVNSGAGRADIVGIAKGTYDIKLSDNNSNSVIRENISVTSYDRSGYAHFNDENGGVGAYDDSGVPKTDAEIVYLTDANKNDNFTYNNKTYKGIVSLLNASKENDFKPLIVRVVGTVGAATWKDDSKMDYRIKYVIDEGVKGDLDADKIVDKNGTKIPTTVSPLNQSDIKNKYNELDTSTYSEITGLTSKMTYKSGDDGDEWDSYWNMCDISEAKNVTIEGIGTDARIFQWGFTWKKCNSIEVRNLTFEDYTEDACSFEGDTKKTNVSSFDSKRIWVHHNTFLEGINYWDVSREQDKHDGDGSTDFKGTAYVTVSYNHYYNNHKTGLVGGDDKNYSANFTFHHNYYDEAWSRLPLGRQANMHMYNNYYKAGSKTSYFTSLRASAFMFAENCYYDTTAKKANIVDTYKESEVSSSKLPGYAKFYNCIFNGKTDSLDKIEQNWAVNTYFKVVQNRTDTVDAQAVKGTTYSCKFGQNFDTDANLFYYDNRNHKTKVTEMLETEQVKTVIPEVAGVHKNKT